VPGCPGGGSFASALGTEWKWECVQRVQVIGNKLGGSPTLGILDLVEPPWISLVGTFVDLGQPEAQVSGTVQRQPAGFAYSIQKDCGKRFKGSTAETPLLVTTYKMLQDWRFASFLYSTAQPKDVYADYLFTNDVAWLKGAIVLNVGWCVDLLIKQSFMVLPGCDDSALHVPFQWRGYPHQFLNVSYIL
jgi:hypothetical protein